MQQEISLEQSQKEIQNRILELERNHSSQEQERIGEGAQGVCYRFQERVYKFLNLPNEQFTLDELRQMNRFELWCLQELASSYYTCEVQNNLCDNNLHLWITTAYMNQGSLNMDCLFQSNNIYETLSLETLSIICKRLIKILNYFHKRLIFHLDVRPDNILLHQEYQFQYQTQNNGQEFQINDGLIRLRELLTQGQQQINEPNNFQPDYVNLQFILSTFGDFIHYNEQIPITKLRFSQENVDELIYWIKNWLVFQNRNQFNPFNIYIKKGIRICFCDFGLAKKIDQTDNNQPIFESIFYKTPYQILGGIIIQQQQVQAWKIARQQDLFRLGITLCNLLQNNRHIEFKDIILNQENQKRLLQFIQQTYPQQKNNNILETVPPSDQKILLQYYSLITEIRRQLNYQNNQNTGIQEFLLMIQEMLSFSFTPSVQFDKILENRDNNIPLNIIQVLQKCRELEKSQYP